MKSYTVQWATSYDVQLLQGGQSICEYIYWAVVQYIY